MSDLLNRQYQYFRTNKDAISAKYPGQHVVVHNEQVVESFGSERDAYIYCIKHFKIGTFFIQATPKLES